MVHESIKYMRQFALLGSVLVLGLIITWTATREALRMAEGEAEANFRGHAELYIDRLQSQIVNGLVAAQDLDNYYHAGEQLEEPTFQRLVSANTHFRNNARMVGVVWRVESGKTNLFPELMNEVYGDDRGFAARYANSFEGRYPFFYVWTADRHSKNELLGRDIGEDEKIKGFLDKAIQDSLPSAMLISSGAFIQEEGKQYVLAAHPAVSKGGDRVAIVQLLDFSMLRAAAVVTDVFSEDEFDLSVTTSFISDGQNHSSSEAEGEFLLASGGFEKILNLGAGHWHFEAMPKEGAIRTDYRPAVVTASVSLLLTGLFVFIFLSQSQRAERIAAIVKRRTRALKEAHEELEDHYRLLQKMNRDVEEARSAAELANRTKSEFLATMSHELRTPLNAILGFSQLLSEQALGDIGDPRYVEYSRDIHASGSHLLSLINDILDLAKLEAGQVKIEKKPVYVKPLVEKVMHILSQQAMDKGIELYAEFAETLPECLIGDELRLRQILINLCSNAIKFTNEGSVVARLHAKHFKNGQPAWVLEVQDTGIGIPEDKQSTLFDRFTQVDAALSRRHGGVGLGLAICRELVDRMEGKISVRSIPTIGTTIRIHLPLEEASSGVILDDDRLI